MSPQGRPKGEFPRSAGRRAAPGVLNCPQGRPKGEFPRSAGRRAAPGVLN
jgi:hypothetical protein